MKKMKKFLSIFLSVVMLIGVLSGMEISANADIPNAMKITTHSSDNTAEVTGYTGSDTNVVIPSKILQYTVTAIGQDAFMDCSSIVSITMPDSVTSIGNSAFVRCSSLAELTLPENLKTIGGYAFSCCDSLKEVVIPNSVISMGGAAFMTCNNLTNAVIGNGITTIEMWAFEGCKNLENVTIPSSVMSVAYGAFMYCDKLSNVYYTGSQEEWNKISIGTSNACLTNATIHYNYRSPQNEPTEPENPTEPQPALPAQPQQQGQTNTMGTTAQQDNQQQSAFAKKAPKGAVIIGGEYIAKKQKRASISKIKSGRKSVAVSWKKVSGVTGYEIQYSTSKKFTKKTTKKSVIKKNKTTKATLKKLKSKKKYYVRIRTYKNVKFGRKTVKVYSQWSKAKTVKVK